MADARRIPFTFCQEIPDSSEDDSNLTPQGRLDAINQILARAILRRKCRLSREKPIVENDAINAEINLIDAPDKWHINDDPNPAVVSRRLK